MSLERSMRRKRARHSVASDAHGRRQCGTWARDFVLKLMAIDADKKRSQLAVNDGPDGKRIITLMVEGQEEGYRMDAEFAVLVAQWLENPLCHWQWWAGQAASWARDLRTMADLCTKDIEASGPVN